MSWTTMMLIGAGGALGSALRYLTGRWVSTRGARPIASTLIVNLAGSLAAGILIGLELQQANHDLYALLGAGFLGGLTTYSALNVQKATLAGEGAGRTLARYAAATYIGGWVLTGLGVAVGHAIG